LRPQWVAAIGGDALTAFRVQDDIAIAVKLIDAQFPPYDQVNRPCRRRRK